MLGEIKWLKQKSDICWCKRP